jgi:Fe2+ or Zn2+ uptake regulation protein
LVSKEIDYPVLRCLSEASDPPTAFVIRTKTGFGHRDIYLSLKGLLEAKLIERVTRGSTGTTYRLTREGKAMISEETGKE